MNLKVYILHIYTFIILYILYIGMRIYYIYPHSYVESENTVLIYAWMVFPTIHMSLHYDCYDTYL